MHTITTSTATALPADAAMIARIATLRESVRDQKQRALAMWQASQRQETTVTERPSLGKFTRQLAHCE